MDEVLAVGDTAFEQKTPGNVGEVVLRAGRPRFFDVEPGVIVARPTRTAGRETVVALTHSWRLPA